MKSNAYLRFSIAIFPVNVSWQYKLFKRYRFGVFTKTEHIFAHDDFSKTKYCPLHQETSIYNCQTAIPWFNVDISRKNCLLSWFLWRFFLVFFFIFHCFLVFWIKFPPICKIRVHNHVENACQRLLLAAYFM
jgi:hypothetical protein